jgi:DNA-binding transcriptional MocR family regulator
LLGRIREIAAAILTGTDASVLQYGATRGYRPPSRRCRTPKHRGSQPADEIIIATGSQQGLDLCARVFLDAGDVALVELPAYTGAMTSFWNAQGHLVGVQQDGAGIDIADLDRVLLRERAAGRRVAFVYVVPNFQNPTGLLMTLARRAELLAWAAARDVLIVEDDPYGALFFDDVATFAETRPSRRTTARPVVYLSSFSNRGSRIRVAWIAAAAPSSRGSRSRNSRRTCAPAPLISGSSTRSGAAVARGRQAAAQRLPAEANRARAGASTGAGWSRDLARAQGGFFLGLVRRRDRHALLRRAIARGGVRSGQRVLRRAHTPRPREAFVFRAAAGPHRDGRSTAGERRARRAQGKVRTGTTGGLGSGANGVGSPAAGMNPMTVAPATISVVIATSIGTPPFKKTCGGAARSVLNVSSPAGAPVEVA